MLFLEDGARMNWQRAVEIWSQKKQAKAVSQWQSSQTQRVLQKLQQQDRDGLLQIIGNPTTEYEEKLALCMMRSFPQVRPADPSFRQTFKQRGSRQKFKQALGRNSNLPRPYG